MKRLITIITLLLFASAVLPAQELVSSIKGTVVSRNGRQPIEGATVAIYSEGIEIFSCKTDSEGKFLIRNVANGKYGLTIGAADYLQTAVNLSLEGYLKDLMVISLTPAQAVSEVDDSNFAELDMDDSGYTDTPSIIFGNNDPFNNLAGYGFSAIRFKNRGYDSETQKVLIAGVPMDDALTGYNTFSLWGGLNEAMRSKDNSVGLDDLGSGAEGGFNGMTNFSATPSSMRKGWRFSILSNSALYRLRLMGSYASGELDNGWSYGFNVSARLGGNDWVEGLYYRMFGFYGGVEKKISDEHRLALIAFVSPGSRGAQNASTQEVYDLMGDNMYNSNWGYQNGKVRNARVKKTFEPVVALKYDYTPSEDFNASATLLFKTGKNGYTALDWYDAPDPRPDYYRNLPSYFYMEDNDYNRVNEEKAEWATYSWTDRSGYCDNYQHINWDRLYNVNYAQSNGRSKYALEERHVDQNEINLATTFKWRQSDFFTLDGGLNARLNSTENYKKLNDLLGGQYYLNVDQFAEREYASNEGKIQNDLDYYLKHGTAEKIGKGGKYGYDYMAEVRRAVLWADGVYTFEGLRASVSGSIGYESFWRNGLLRKGLFAGLDDNGQPYEGLTTYDSNGRVITSKGKSDVSSFLTFSGKAAVSYTLNGGHRFSLNAGFFNDAPTFNQSFISARTRNTLVDGLTTIKTFSGDFTYRYSNRGYDVRATAFYTTIADKTDVMSFYDDSQQSFTNFAMTGIDERHVGIEIGAKVPLPLQGLSVSGALSLGEYVYTSTPHMVQTIDNSASIVRDENVTFWKSHPTYVKNEAGEYEYDHENKHYIPSTPQLAGELALNYRTNSYWFFELNGQYFAHSYLDMNPLYRTEFACKGAESNPTIVDYMASQEEFDPAFLLNCSIGKSWYIRRTYSFGFSLEVKNMLNNTGVKTGGYEQTRLISSYGKDRYYKFDSKYFYMCGANYMLNLYFRF